MTEYKTIDLGLPSGILWADRNVGAASPEAFGDYFAWGETKPRGENWGTEAPYEWKNAPFNDGSEEFGKKYFSEHKSEWLTENRTLKPEHDAAHVIIGGSWRMPTLAEIKELIDGTTQAREKLNGVKGVRFISKANGNSIFMPLAGYRYCTKVIRVGRNGYAWSSSLCSGDAGFSGSLYFDGRGYASVDYDIRCAGFVVRGVRA